MHTTTDNQAKTFTAEKSRIQDFTDFTAEFPHEHAFLFDGIILGICSKGNMRFKINYNEYHISANEAFIILPRHIFTIIRTSPDLQLKILRFSSDFLLTLPTNPDFSLARRISHYPCISIQPQDMENIQLLHTMARQYENHRLFHTRLDKWHHNNYCQTVSENELPNHTRHIRGTPLSDRIIIYTFLQTTHRLHSAKI